MSDTRTLAGVMVRMSATPPSIEIELWPRCSVHIEAKKEFLRELKSNYIFKSVIVEYEMGETGYPRLIDIHMKGADNE